LIDWIDEQGRYKFDHRCPFLGDLPCLEEAPRPRRQKRLSLWPRPRRLTPLPEPYPCPADRRSREARLADTPPRRPRASGV
jgi:hypothetical protein